MADDVIVDPPASNIQGVSEKVAKGFEKLLKKGRRYFGSSGASLTHQVSNPDVLAKNEGLNTKLARVGLEGERDTSEFLKKWIADKPNAVLVDSVHIRGWGKEEVDEETGFIDGGDTDHVILIGSEVILIDSKRWKEKAAYQVADDGSVTRNRKAFAGGKVHMKQAIYMWLDYLYDGASITGIVCINSDGAVVWRNRNWYVQPYRLVEIDRLGELLNEKYDSHINDYDKHHINTTLVAQVAVNAVKPYDERLRVLDKTALREFTKNL